jgi:DNA polymerase-3 subunit epsilon
MLASARGKPAGVGPGDWQAGKAYSLSGTRRKLRRAQSYQWQPPAAEPDIADETSRERWDTARAKAIAWASAVANDPRAVYLDTETTGFGPRAEIIDIAVVSGAGEVLLESLVQPRRRIPWDATAIHGITDTDVRDAPFWIDLYDEVMRALDGRRIVVYNVTFDKQMVSQACDQYALAAPTAQWDCAMKKYAGFHGNWDPRKRWFSFVKLERAVLTFGAEPGGHRAAADAFACRAVVLGMATTPPPEVGHGLPETLPELARPWPAESPTASLAALGTLARWAQASKDFSALLASIPAEFRERPGACGGWSVREVAAHAAGWEWEGARRLRRITADPTLPDAVYNVDGFNAANVTIRARQTWSDTIEELTKASRTFGMAAAVLPDDRRTREWLAGRAKDFEEHAAEIRRWLASMSFQLAASSPSASRPAGSDSEHPLVKAKSR